MEGNFQLSQTIFLAFKRGDQRAFEKIFEAYQPLIASYVLGFTHSLEESEEICHEAFVKLYLKREQIASSDGVYPYLFTIAKRITISNFRKKVSHKKYEDCLKNSWQEAVDDTREQIAAREFEKAIDHEVQLLPLKQREVYLLNKRQELSYLEIANLMGISINTVRNHLVGAVKQLKLRLAEYHVSLLAGSILLFF